jgi:hypothetical protein
MTETKPQKHLVGYARVSTYGQTLDAQPEQLRAAGCANRNIYRVKVTGAHSDRRELLKMLKALARGDVVTVTRIDRLARSTFDLFGIVKHIVDAKAQFRSLAEPWAGTQHRALDAGRTRRLGRRGARSNPHPDGRGQKPRQGPRAADGPTPCPQPAQQKEATRRRARSYASRTRPQLQRRPIYHSPRHQSRVTDPSRLTYI